MDPPNAHLMQIVSDLHFDESTKGYDLHIPALCPSLALLGDIGKMTEIDRLFGFLKKQLLRFHVIFFVLGNHEPFGSDHKTCIETIRNFEAAVNATPDAHGRLVVLERTRYDLSPTLTILGCTLFSAIDHTHAPLIASTVKDFAHIKAWTTPQHTAAHARDLAWLNAQVSHIATHEPHRRVVLLTHYSPTRAPQALDPRHADSVRVSAYATDLRNEICWRAGVVKLWAFGHTHWNCDLEVDGVRVVSNQRGYEARPAEGFDPGKSIALE